MTETIAKPAATDDPPSAMWTARLRRAWLDRLPPDQLLPDRQPAYVASWIYVFGVLTIAALVMIILSGLVLSFTGPAWYHSSSIGLFVNLFTSICVSRTHYEVELSQRQNAATLSI